jgi:membrane protease YdiL (CAAX protease family)
MPKNGTKKIKNKYDISHENLRLKHMFRTRLRNHELIVYFFIAFVFTWSISAILILSKFGVIKPFPLWMHSFTAYGPLISAFIVTGLCRGSTGVKSLFLRIIEWKIGFRWFIVSALSLITIFVFAGVIFYLLTGQGINIGLLGQLDNTANLGISGAWLFSVLTSGIGEETGWRGFALPRLQKSRSAFTSTIILSIIWAFWHLPYFFYVPGYMIWGLADFPFIILGLIIGGFILTWLYNSTKGSVLAVAMWHGSFDFVTTTKGASVSVAVFVCAIILLWGLIIPFIYRHESLSAKQKQII